MKNTLWGIVGVLLGAYLAYFFYNVDGGSFGAAVTPSSFSVNARFNVTLGQTATTAIRIAGGEYAWVSNLASSAAWCAQDNALTAASSSVSATSTYSGFIIYPSSTQPGSKYFSNGYVGNLNCVAQASAVLYIETTQSSRFTQ